MGVLNTILDMVFPVNCTSCGKGGELLCLECIASFPKAERECEKWIYPLYDYRDRGVKRAIWLLKYNKKKELANIFGELISENILQELLDLSVFQNFREPILIPIPLSSLRRKERGYNQAELLCKKIVESQNNDFELLKNVLIKTKETEHQANIKDRSTRLKNLTGSFKVNDTEKIKGRNIILIDDVTTTGATLGEAKKVLREAGAKKVIAFTIAH